MAVREGSGWSRAWGAVAVSGFAVHLGAAIFEAAVIAPLWILDPPRSVAAWIAIKTRPDASTLYHPLVAVVVVATSMAWLTGILTRGWRRWWLTLALASAAALAFVTVQMMRPVERELFGAGGLTADAATMTAWTNDWIRASALRLAALLAGTFTMYRAQLTSALAERDAEVLGDFDDALSAHSGGGRKRDFTLGDEHEDEISLGEEALNPRQRWRSSLAGRRRTAKK